MEERMEMIGQEKIEPPSEEGIRKALKKMNNHKAPGIYNMAAKLFKYRGITLLCEVCKVFSRVLARSLAPRVENLLGDYQCGFRHKAMG